MPENLVLVILELALAHPRLGRVVRLNLALLLSEISFYLNPFPKFW